MIDGPLFWAYVGMGAFAVVFSTGLLAYILTFLYRINR